MSICGQEQGGVAYRFGRASRIELEATDLHRAHEGWSGGGETQVYADTSTHRYVVYDQMVRIGFDDEGHNIPRMTQGLLVQSVGRTLSSQECAQPVGLSPPGFDQRLLETLVPEGAPLSGRNGASARERKFYLRKKKLLHERPKKPITLP